MPLESWGQMFDAVVVAAIPASAQIVAGYIDGHYVTVPALRLSHPHAYVVTITVTGKAGARVCDVESGDLTPLHGAQWAASELRAHRKPTIYCSLSNWGHVEIELNKMGISSAAVDWWIAHALVVGQVPTFRPPVPAGAVALQFAFDVPHNGHAYDESVTNGHWPWPPKAPVIPDFHPPIVKPPLCTP
jgi:hypothetical protein